MFGWTIAFLVVALIAAAIGFGVLAGTAFAAAKSYSWQPCLRFLFRHSRFSHAECLSPVFRPKKPGRNAMKISFRIWNQAGAGRLFGVLSTGHLLREIWHERNPHKQG
jgi:hypothetical protein